MMLQAVSYYTHPFHWCPVTGQEAMGINRHTEDSVRISGNILLWGWWSTRRGSPERLWAPPLQIFRSHLDVVLGGLAWARLVGQCDLQRSCLTLTNLWFCNTQFGMSLPEMACVFVLCGGYFCCCCFPVVLTNLALPDEFLTNWNFKSDPKCSPLINLS